MDRKAKRKYLGWSHFQMLRVEIAQWFWLFTERATGWVTFVESM